MGFSSLRRSSPTAALLAAAIAALVVVATPACRLIREAVDDIPRPTSLRTAWQKLKASPQATVIVPINNNAQAWAVRWQQVSSASKTIDVTYFIVDQDVFGLAFIGRLLERAEAGVTVRLLIDARGSQDLAVNFRDHLQELVHSGVVVKVYNPPLPQLFRAMAESSPTAVVASTHNKIIVIDGVAAITGGRNIGSRYFSKADEDPQAFIDADVLLEGAEAARALTAVMNAELGADGNETVPSDIVNIVSRREELLLIGAAMDAWMTGSVAKGSVDVVVAALEKAALAQIKGKPDPAAVDAARPRFAELAELTSVWGKVPAKEVKRYDVETRVLSAEARVQRRDDSVNDAFVRAVSGTQEKILLESPYFIPSPRLVRAFEEASKRDVSITLLTNSPLSSDNDASQALFIDSWPEIVARVPTLRVYVGATAQTLHAKRAVFDDHLTFVGSYNLDPFSAHLNSELFVAAWSAEFAAATTAEVTRRLKNGSVIEYVVERDAAGKPRRAAEGEPNAGKILVRFGPDQHTPPARMERLRALKIVLLGQRALWDFEVLAW